MADIPENFRKGGSPPNPVTAAADADAAAGKPRKRAAGRTAAGIELCREYECLKRMCETAGVLYGMLALRQRQAVTDEQRLAFAMDESNVRLADAVIGSYAKIVPYGHPKLESMEYIGDVPLGPAKVENRMTFVLNVSNDQPPGRPATGRGNGHGDSRGSVVTIEHATNGSTRDDD